MKPSKNRLAVVVSSVLFVGILIQVLYDPVSSVNHHLRITNVRSELPQARAKWETLGITDYTFEIVGDARSICKPSAVVEVRGGQVVRVEVKEFVPDDLSMRFLPPEQWSDPDWGEEVFLCSYFHFTIPQFFDLVEQTLQSYPSSMMRAAFDPEHGFIAEFKFGIYVGYSILRPKIENCCNEFSIRNFQVLE